MIVYPGFLLSVISQSLRLPRIGWQTFTRTAGVLVTASDATPLGPMDAPLRADTVDYWQASALPAWWQIDLGAPREIDYVGIAAHSIGSSGATILVETSLDGAAWTVLGAEVIPADDAPLMFLDVPRPARHVRVSLSGVAVPKLAVIYVGKTLVMERGPEMGYQPITLNRVTDAHNSVSRGGHFLGRGIRRMGVKSSITFARLSQAFYRSLFEPFVKEARRYPYFFAWCPELFANEVAYVWTTDDFEPSYTEWDWFSITWEMEGIGNA